jgi:16S rRNA (guanine527-N7)-methyltransferase
VPETPGAPGDPPSAPLEPPNPDAGFDHLRLVLEESGRRGLLGGDPEHHIRHSEIFARLIRQRSPTPSNLLDLGAGGGVPGLVLSILLERSTVVLLDASSRRCRFLEWAVTELGMTERVSVVHGRAEDLARGELRQGFDVATSRSFGPPAVTAECTRGFLVDGGVLVVSDPPAPGSRWPIGALGDMGYGPPHHVVVEGQHFTLIEAIGTCPEELPRRNGVPGRRPRF